MTSSRPYLVRALHAWISDNHMTPHLLVDAHAPGVRVPEQAIQNGKVVLNVSAGAVKGLVMGNEVIEFAARFSGVSQDVVVPVEAVHAIYARENGQGMMFPESDGDGPGPGGDEGDDDGGGRAPHLKVVK